MLPLIKNQLSNFFKMSWKNVFDDREIFLKFVKKYYDKHIQEKKPCFVWHKKMPTIQEYISSKEFNKSENLEAFSLDSMEDHAVYKSSSIDYWSFGEKYNDVLEHFRKYFNLKYAYAEYNVQKPGKFFSPHTDQNGPLIRTCPFDVKPTDIRRYIIFLQPWKMGQVWMLGVEAVTNWDQYSVIEFPWYMPHATANVSAFERHLISVAGVTA